MFLLLIGLSLQQSSRLSSYPSPTTRLGAIGSGHLDVQALLLGLLLRPLLESRPLSSFLGFGNLRSNGPPHCGRCNTCELSSRYGLLVSSFHPEFVHMHVHVHFLGGGTTVASPLILPLLHLGFLLMGLCIGTQFGFAHWLLCTYASLGVQSSKGIFGVDEVIGSIHEIPQGCQGLSHYFYHKRASGLDAT